MKLAKVCTTEGAVRVAVIEGEEAKLLPSGEDGAASLTQIHL